MAPGACRREVEERLVRIYAHGLRRAAVLRMVEHYETDYHTIDCRADYSNFRPFEVDVKFEIGKPF